MISALLLVVAQTPAAAPQEAESKVLKYAVGSIGSRVGSGQCSDLATAAIRSVDPNFRRKPDYPNKEDYVWGEFVYGCSLLNGQLRESPNEEALLKVQPGDIVQMRNCRFEFTSSTRWETSTFDHHTAVIRSVSKDGMKWKILQQNYNNKMYVTEDAVNLLELKSGYFNVYRYPEKK